MGKQAVKDRRRFGWLCSYTPIEILMAAGFVPTRLDAGELPSPKPNPHIYQLLCPYVRSVFDGAQKNHFGPLQGVVFMKCCDAMFRLYDLWQAHLKDMSSYVLPLPKVRSNASVTYFSKTLRRFADRLANDTGTSISDSSLGKAIAELNRLREAVQELYKVRQANPQSLAYSKLRLLIREWLSMDPVRALKGVEEALEELKRSRSVSSHMEANVLISSSTLDQIGLIRLIEDAGITVADDDLCTGYRHFDTRVSEDGDPYLNLANRYLKRWPCARMHGDPSHLQRLTQEIDAVHAKGVIYVGLKYCDQPSFDFPRLQAQLSECHIPVLYIENDYTESGFGQLRVRIEAFAEMLREEV